MKEFIYVLSANGEKCLYGTKQVFCTVPEDNSEAVPSETVPEGEVITEGGAA